MLVAIARKAFDDYNYNLKTDLLNYISTLDKFASKAFN